MEMPISEKTPLGKSQPKSHYDGNTIPNNDLEKPSKGGVSDTNLDMNPDSSSLDTNNDTSSNVGDKTGFSFYRSLSGRRKYTLIFVVMAHFLSSASFALLGSFYPMVATRKGMDISTVGVVFGVYQIVIFITAPIYGNYLVTLGPRFVFIAGIFVAGWCNILFGTLVYCPSGTPFIVMSLLVRSVEALGFSASCTSGYAIVSSEFKEHVGLTFGILEAGSGFGFMISPTIGGALYELGGFGTPFYSVGVVILLNTIAVYKFLPPVTELPTKRVGSMLTLLRSPMVIVQIGSVLVVMIGVTTYDATFAKRLEPLKFSVVMVGVLFGVLSLLTSVMSSLWGYISDNTTIQAPLTILGHFVFGSGFLLMGPSYLAPFNRISSYDIATIVIGLACVGISYGSLLIPTMKNMIIGANELGFENNIDTNALVSGLLNSVIPFGGFIGPIGVSYIVQECGFPVAYTVVGMASIFMMVVSFVFFIIRKANR